VIVDAAALSMLEFGVPAVGVSDMVDDCEVVEDVEMVEDELVPEKGGGREGAGEGVELLVSDAIGVEDVGENVAAETPLSSFNGTKLI